MRTYRRTSIAIAAAVVIATAFSTVALATGSHHGSPVIEKAPASPPATSRHHGVCVVASTADSGGATHGLVWVRPNPTSVVTIWLPGLNSRRCHARRIVAGAGKAERLATAIEQAPRVASGAYPCPNDDATRVRIYLRYPAGGDEYAAISLSGCRWIEAPGRTSRWVRSRLDRVLRSVAPMPWQRYLS